MIYLDLSEENIEPLLESQMNIVIKSSPRLAIVPLAVDHSMGSGPHSKMNVLNDIQ